MTKIELEKQIKELEEKQAELQKQIDELKKIKIEELKKKWKPEIDEKYFYISYEGTVCLATWSNDDLDNWRYFIGIIFQTSQEAREYRKKIEIQARFRNFMQERNEELDWENYDQDKYCLLYNHDNKKIVLECAFVKKYQGVIYASSEQILKDVIAEIGEENIKKYVLGVEE